VAGNAKKSTDELAFLHFRHTRPVKVLLTAAFKTAKPHGYTIDEQKSAPPKKTPHQTNKKDHEMPTNMDYWPKQTISDCGILSDQTDIWKWTHCTNHIWFDHFL
jgi:hypothetical protein